MERSGFKKIYYAPIVDGSYSSWVELPDVEELTSSILGSTEPRYCGDQIAGVQETFKGEQLTLKAAAFPESFKTNCLNYIKTNSGSFVKVENGKKPYFALGYVEVIDGEDVIKVYPKCYAGNYSENAKTQNATAEYQTVDLPVIAHTVNIGGKNVVAEEGIPYTDGYFNTIYSLPTINS